MVIKTYGYAICENIQHYLDKEFKEIMFSYEKKYEIKGSCKDHVDEVFKCAYVEVKFLMDFFKYAIEY